MRWVNEVGGVLWGMAMSMIVATVADAGTNAVGGAADTRWVWVASSWPASSSSRFPLGVRTSIERRVTVPGSQLVSSRS
jgi:hypothetical protein